MATTVFTNLARGMKRGVERQAPSIRRALHHGAHAIRNGASKQSDIMANGMRAVTWAPARNIGALEARRKHNVFFPGVSRGFRKEMATAGEDLAAVLRNFLENPQAQTLLQKAGFAAPCAAGVAAVASPLLPLTTLVQKGKSIPTAVQVMTEGGVRNAFSGAKSQAKATFVQRGGQIFVYNAIKTQMESKGYSSDLANASAAVAASILDTATMGRVDAKSVLNTLGSNVAVRRVLAVISLRDLAATGGALGVSPVVQEVMFGKEGAQTASLSERALALFGAMALTNMLSTAFDAAKTRIASGASVQDIGRAFAKSPKDFMRGYTPRIARLFPIVFTAKEAVGIAKKLSDALQPFMPREDLLVEV